MLSQRVRTNWPWDSRIAPASWLMARDVKEGRAHLNFSEWHRLSTKEQVELMDEAWEEVAEGEMPLWFDLPMHPEGVVVALIDGCWQAFIGGCEV